MMYGCRYWRLLVVLAAIVLHGCASAPRLQFTNFPTPDDLRTPESRRSSYEEAREDFQRAAKGLHPRHAVRHDALYDGGTVFYKGNGYDLTVWKRLSLTPGGMTYIYSGPEIRFSRSLSPRGAASYSIAQSRKLR